MGPAEVKPIFILSLPRSGSTLLQRLLSAHSKISSVAEPWLLLPLAGLTEAGGLRHFSEYSSRLSATAIREMIEALPGGQSEFNSALRHFCEEIYAGLSEDGSSYFVDKTPRYHLIADFIFDVFPDAKVIFLFRHPLDILSSLVTTFSRGRFAIHHAHVDVFEGPPRLHEAAGRFADRAVVVTYEDLVTRPESTLRFVTEYLDLDFEDHMVDGYQDVSFSGSMGDRTGDAKYRAVQSGSLGRWRSVLTTHTRVRFARRYVRWLGPDVLRTFGVSAADLEEELRAMRGSVRGSLTDAFWLASSTLARRLAGNVVRHQWSRRSVATHKLD